MKTGVSRVEYVLFNRNRFPTAVVADRGECFRLSEVFAAAGDVLPSVFLPGQSPEEEYCTLYSKL